MDIDPYAILEMRIRTGAYAPGSWLDPERQLASEFGVNRGTIRRAISRLADAGMISCRAGHRPVVLQPKDRGREPAAIALLMGNEPKFHAFQLVARGCEPVLRANGYRLLFMDTWGVRYVCTEREIAALDSLIEHPVAGVILWCQNPVASLSRLQFLQQGGCPIVSIDREVPGSATDFVGIDNLDAARSATEHLLSLGHRRIGHLTRPEETSPVREREQGYRRALENAGIRIDENIIFRLRSDETPETDQQWAAQFAEMPDRPTALFAVNDILALRVINLLRNRGLRVPEDIAVVGFDDVESHSVQEPFLTTLRQPYESVGRHAADLIVERLRSPDAPLRHIVLETTLVRRRSSGTKSEVPAPPDHRTVSSYLPVTGSVTDDRPISRLAVAGLGDL